MGSLEVGAATDMLATDEDVWHGLLSANLLKAGLDCIAIRDLVEFVSLE